MIVQRIFFLYRLSRTDASGGCMYTELDLFFLIYSAGRQLRRLNLLVLSTFSVVKLRWNINQASCPKKNRKTPLHSTPNPFAPIVFSKPVKIRSHFQAPPLLIPALSINPLNVVCRLSSSSRSSPLPTDKKGVPSARSANRACEAGTRVGVLS